MSDQWMGSIAAQDQYRELGNDPWTNTMRGTPAAPGQGFAPVQQSPVLYNTKAGPITEADIGTATEAAMGVSGGGLSTKPTFVNRGGGMFDARIGDKFAGTASIAGDGTKPFLSAISVEPQFRGQGIGRGLYEQAETSLGRPLVPSPLGLSEDATRLWQKRLAGMDPKEARALVDEARQLGVSYGLKPEQIANRLDDLIKERQGIKAYHSSPHDFDRFDLARIGTGEGAQVYGHGLYFAENPAVSGQGGQYWNQFARRFQGPDTDPVVVHAVQMLEASGGNRAAALAKGEAALKGEYRAKTLPDAVALLRSDKQVGPRTYEVNINADPAHMLDWDKPLREQAAAGALEKLPVEMFSKWKETGAWPHVTGQSAYREMAGGLINRAHAEGLHAKASEALREAGIPGIKYLDQGSRNVPANLASLKADIAKAQASGDQSLVAHYQSYLDRLPKPSSNYVVFDPSIVDITKKYGIPGAIGAGGMGALADQSGYQSEERM